MAPQRRIDNALVSRIVELAIGSDSTPAEIHRKVSEEQWTVSTRTVERIVKEYRATDESPLWTVENSDPEDAKLILAWLASFNGFGKGLTEVEAFWHLKIQRIAPDLSFVRAGILANLYRIRTAQEASTDELDAYLGFAPWLGAEALERYKEMVGAGWVKPITMWDIMVDFRWS